VSIAAEKSLMMQRVYKILEEAAWGDAIGQGAFHGASIDLADGFIHLSAADQVVETAARHFAGREGLVLVAFDAAHFGSALVWEVSRGGALFPHLYGVLPVNAALWVKPLPVGADGRHVFPALDA
jgi:uncharacterized protein (DUF952 family)